MDMFAMRALIVMSLLTIGSSARAQNQNDQGAGTSVYATTACWVPNCYMTATGLGYPNPVPYETFAKLTLPPGNYLIHGKLSAYTNSPVIWGNLECYMGLDAYGVTVPADWWNFTDYSSVAYSSGYSSDQKVVSMVLTVKLTAPSTTVGIGCKLAGWYYDSQGNQASFQVGVWGVRLIAERIGSVVQRIVN
jgi:hypothetical protein